MMSLRQSSQLKIPELIDGIVHMLPWNSRFLYGYAMACLKMHYTPVVAIEIWKMMLSSTGSAATLFLKFIWGFPKIGLPHTILHFSEIFHEIHHPAFLGDPSSKPPRCFPCASSARLPPRIHAANRSSPDVHPEQLAGRNTPGEAWIIKGNPR